MTLAVDGLITLRAVTGLRKRWTDSSSQARAKSLAYLQILTTGQCRHGGTVFATDEVVDLRQRQGRYAADTVRSDHRHRPATEGPSVGRCGGSNIPDWPANQARRGSGRGRRGEQHVNCIESNC
jgi:hypothetical protein